MPKFLENALRHEYSKRGLTGKRLQHAIYGSMNNIGALHGSRETEKGAEMERKHESDQKKGKTMAKEPAVKIEHMRITPAENGGHVVEHHFAPKMQKTGAFMEHQEPEKHVFGPGDGHKMIAHVKKHLGIGAAPSPKTEQAELEPSEPIEGHEQGEYESDEQGT